MKHDDWFSIYRNLGNPNYSPEGPKTSFHINICKDFRNQLKILWCRILSVKRGQIYSSIMFTTAGLPNYVKTNLRQIIWEKSTTDQDEINAMFHWSNDKKNEILNLIHSKNPFERLCDNLSSTLMHNSLSHVSEKDARTIKKDKDETMRISYVDREAQLYLFDSITAVKYVIPEGKSRYEGAFYCESKDGVIEQLQNIWILIYFDHNFLEAVMKASSSNEFILLEQKMELFYDNRQNSKATLCDNVQATTF